MSELVTDIAPLKVARRGFFGFLAGALAAAKVPLPRVAPPATVLPTYVTEFNAIVRRAYVPRVSAQLYTQSPMLSILIPGKGYTTPPAITFTGEPNGP